MPTSSDLVTDLPADFETFGQAVDTSLADLKGGTSGQILSKASNTDMDFTWITNDVGDITAVTASAPLTGGGTSGAITVGIQDGTTSQKGAVQLENSTSSTSTTTAAVPASVKSAYDLANGAIPKTLIDAAGDLIVGTAADTAGRLAIGTAGQILKVNSGATALEWGAASGGGMTLIASGTFSGTSTLISSIPTTYANLVLLVDGWSLSSSGWGLYLRFNDDSTASSHAAGTSFTPGGGSPAAFADTFIQISRDNYGVTSSGKQSTFVTIPGYANTTSWKQGIYYGLSQATSPSTSYVSQAGLGFYNGTSAITSLRILNGASATQTGNYKLYGV